MRVPPLLSGRDRYERVMRGSVDDAHPDALAHTVRLTDDDRAIEVVVVALPPPSYTIRAAALTPVAGPVARPVVDGFARLVGFAMVAGLTRRTVELVGDGDGAALAVDAIVEVARLARQVGRLPRAAAERAASGDPLDCWRLDTTGWVDLPNSCFTYSEAGRALFGTRTIATAMVPDLYSPRPGQQKIFERRKLARLERAGGCLRLFHSMHDNVHGFDLCLEIDEATGTIVHAEHVTPRLPYMGVCSEPQRKFSTLVGETVDAALRQRIQVTLGGVSGCAQLYDLTADLLKLVL